MSVLVKCAAIDDRLRILIAAQHDHEIGNHLGFALLIKLDDLVFAQLVKCHLDHADRPLNDHLTGINDGRRLLALEHDRRNFGRISQMGNARLEYLQTGRSYPLCNLLLKIFGNLLRRTA